MPRGMIVPASVLARRPTLVGGDLFSPMGYGFNLGGIIRTGLGLLTGIQLPPQPPRQLPMLPPAPSYPSIGFGPVSVPLPPTSPLAIPGMIAGGIQQIIGGGGPVRQITPGSYAAAGYGRARRRRMNVFNPRAAARAGRRLDSLSKRIRKLGLCRTCAAPRVRKAARFGRKRR